MATAHELCCRLQGLVQIACKAVLNCMRKQAGIFVRFEYSRYEQQLRLSTMAPLDTKCITQLQGQKTQTKPQKSPKLLHDLLLHDMVTRFNYLHIYFTVFPNFKVLLWFCLRSWQPKECKKVQSIFTEFLLFLIGKTGLCILCDLFASRIAPPSKQVGEHGVLEGPTSHMQSVSQPSERTGK